MTPSYEQAQFLERTIQSVLDQDYPRLEYLILDGGSSDGSVDIIRRYESKLAFWTSKPDRGQVAAVNRGLNMATGDVMIWLNSDDTLAPQALWRIGRCYAERPDVELVYGHTRLIDENDRVVRNLPSVQATCTELIRFNRNIWSVPSASWHRRLQERIGLLDETLRVAADDDFWIRAALAGNVYCIRAHLGNLRIHAATQTNTLAHLFLPEHELLDKRYGREIRSGPAHAIYQWRKRLRILRHPDNWMFLFGRSTGPAWRSALSEEMASPS